MSERKAADAPGRPDRAEAKPNGADVGKNGEKLDEEVVQGLKRLYQPVLEEPVPAEFLEILRRRRR